MLMSCSEMVKSSILGLVLISVCWSCLMVASSAGLRSRPDEYAAPSDLMTFAVSPDGKWIAAFAADGTLLLWDAETWHRREPITNYKVSLGTDSLAFSPDSSLLVVGDANGLIQIFDDHSGLVVKKIQDRDWVEQFAFCSDGSHLATWNHKGITVWDIKTGKELRFFPEESRLSAIALNGDGSLLITGSEDSKIRIWEIEKGQQISVMDLEARDWVNFFALDERQNLLFSAQGQNDIYVWNLSTGKKLRDLKGHSEQVVWLKLLPEKHMLFSIADDGTLKTWDYMAGILKWSWKVQPGFVTDKGDLLISGDSKAKNQIQVWQIASRSLLKTLVYQSPHKGSKEKCQRD